MPPVRVAHTADLPRSELAAIRDLLYEVFDDMEETDYEHGLGGMHAAIWADGTLLAHGSVVMRRLLHEGRALRTGYVEIVAVRPELRRQGLASLVMAELERIIRDGVPFYRSRGWRQWRGATSAFGPRGIERTPDEDGGVFVLPVTAELNLDGDLACDWRDGEVW
jgi:aminoglycoside 2'-N-acetyltransferase I